MAGIMASSPFFLLAGRFSNSGYFASYPSTSIDLP